MDMVYKPIIKRWMWFTIGFFLIGFVWFSYKMDLIIKIGFCLVNSLVMVNLIFCTPLRADPDFFKLMMDISYEFFSFSFYQIDTSYYFSPIYD
jgi:hypothetical protein